LDSTVRQLRQRALALRHLATSLDGSPILSLDAAAGEDTWIGPLAAAFLEAVWRYQQQVLQAVDDLRWLAWQLDERAGQREVELATAAISAG
jgi:hypothetical protein